MESAAVVFRQAADKYTYAKRGRFTAEIEEALNETTSDLGELSSDVEGLSGAALARARRDLKDLRDKVAQLDERNTAAMSATETRWVADRDRITDTFTELMRSFDKFRKSLR